MDARSTSKFAVLNRSTKLRLHYNPDVPRESLIGGTGNDTSDEEITLDAGTLIKVHQLSKEAVGGNKNITVQVLDLVNKQHIFENLFECSQTNLLPVDENLWPFVISIERPEARFKMLLDKDHCQWLMSLHNNDFVCVKGAMFGKAKLRFDCIIRHIGPVTELHSVGYVFGLEILNLESGYSPQADQIPFAEKLIECKPELAIFATADWILPLPKEVQKKYSALDLFTGIAEKVKAAIVPSTSICVSSSGNTSSLKRDKKSKSKTKEATAQFYQHLTQDPTLGLPEMETKRENNDDTKQPIDYERSLERRTNTVQTQTQPQAGILKNKHKDHSRPASLLNDGGRNIVIIDNKEIDDSIRHDVFVVEKPQEDFDLIELLQCTEWSKAAGEAGEMLNKAKLSNTTLKRQSTAGASGNAGNNMSNNNTQTRHSARNKSSNVLAHLGGGGTVKSNRSTEKKAAYAYGPQEMLPAVLDGDFAEETPLKEIPGTNLGVGSMVEVTVPEQTGHLYGVIRWIGALPEAKVVMVGVELEEDYIDKQLNTTNGGLNGIALFKCTPGRGLFVTSDQCSIDRRFLAIEGAVGNDLGSVVNNNYKSKQSNGVVHDDQQTFGHMECPIVPGAVAPIKCSSLNDLEEMCGKFKGIQGHHNSCYLDVTLFSMFAFTPVFDAILYRPPDKEDIAQYTEVQNVLREEIVNPLRKNMFVRADRVMKLRQQLDKLSSVSGLTSEEKDPEEFLNCILAQIMRAEPFLKLNSGQDAYYYQLFVEKDERLLFPSVQQLFEQSFYASDIKLKEVPSCLIIQMPRFGKNYKMYPRILPSQVLDVTDIIEDSPRQCSVCGKLAEFECRDCFGVLQNGIGLESTSYCPQCLETVHMHTKRLNHNHRKLLVPEDFRVMGNISVPRLYMELFAVVCIETSHYVTFVKAGSGPDAPWCFFDSMADRKGEQNGYNIPEMITVPDLPQWLSDEGARTINETSSNDKMLPEHAKRLFCDAYMCMYQSTDVMMYR